MSVDTSLHRQFIQRLESVGGSVSTCTIDQAADLVVEAAKAFPGEPVIYTGAVQTMASALLEKLGAAGLTLRAAGSVDDALTCPLALSTGALAVAETGSVITADRELGQRAPSMLSTVNVVLVPADRLVPSLVHAAIWLGENVRTSPYVSFITGPSRSADIERTLTIGVQGPRSLIVVFLEES
jgi:L-lactate dehydrogenase complex protein LldG